MRIKAIAIMLMLTAGLALPSTAGADPATSCDYNPCYDLPYSFTVIVNGAVIPHMDTRLLVAWQRDDDGSPLLQTTPETYVTNADGTVTGTVTADVTVGLSVSEALGNDVTVWFGGPTPQDGSICPPGPCSIPDFPCTLQAGQTSTSCDFPDWWQAFSSDVQYGYPFDWNVIYTDPGQWNRDIANGHPYSYGFGFTILTAFIPTPPGSAPAARQAVQPDLRSFTVRYHPVFSGSFTLDVIRHGTTVVARQPLGQKKPGAYSTTFNCGTRNGHLTLVVVGRQPGKVQRSNPKAVTC